ncbi:uncharacterized protein LOC113759369 [Coffea eugenioides]|uniref:uncharacterized protein LOC113759369 n=1 Tax=Coffea eugenioides TaxID=49369 RepID=UPI000F60C0CC|nr:uncharacterized protein LOC113759369 [Coffea eugenioides]
MSVSSRQAFGGGLVRDDEGKMIFAYYKEFGECDVLMVEGLSLLHGLRLCLQREVHLLRVEVDSATLVEPVTTNALAKSPLRNVVREVRWILGQLSGQLRHVYRERNAASDALASLQLGQDNFWIEF